MNTKSTTINLINLEKGIVKAFCLLNINPLEKLDEKAIYSYNYKNEMIAELQSVFDKIKSTGVQSLEVKNSKCKYCYPSANAYSFHNPITDEFIIRYVIGQDEDGMYRVEECKNKPITTGEDGMPF